MLSSVTSTSNTIEIVCADLDELEGGMITYSSGSQNMRPLDSTAAYSCESGYKLIGQATRTCQDDETWSEQEPTCDGK